MLEGERSICCLVEHNKSEIMASLNDEMMVANEDLVIMWSADGKGVGLESQTNGLIAVRFPGWRLPHILGHRTLHAGSSS